MSVVFFSLILLSCPQLQVKFCVYPKYLDIHACPDWVSVWMVCSSAETFFLLCCNVVFTLIFGAMKNGIWPPHWLDLISIRLYAKNYQNISDSSRVMAISLTDHRLFKLFRFRQGCLSGTLPALMAQLDVCPTGDQEVAGSTPPRSATFFHGD